MHQCGYFSYENCIKISGTERSFHMYFSFPCLSFTLDIFCAAVSARKSRQHNNQIRHQGLQATHVVSISQIHTFVCKYVFIGIVIIIQTGGHLQMLHYLLVCHQYYLNKALENSCAPQGLWSSCCLFLDLLFNIWCQGY